MATGVAAGVARGSVLLVDRPNATGATATPDTLKAHVREQLANYKVPRSITVLEGLPRGSTGKILRRELQELVPTDGDGA